MKVDWREDGCWGEYGEVGQHQNAVTGKLNELRRTWMEAVVTFCMVPFHNLPVSSVESQILRIFLWCNDSFNVNSLYEYHTYIFVSLFSFCFYFIVPSCSRNEHQRGVNEDGSMKFHTIRDSRPSITPDKPEGHGGCKIWIMRQSNVMKNV
jgi:hypothetical protein